MKIISGGQTGADITGLIIAKKHGFVTGGNIPKGCVTLDGLKPEYIQLFDMKETTTTDYPTRTKLNVIESECTIWFGEKRFSAGKLCTFKHIRKYNRPSIDIDINDFLPVDELYDWIVSNKFEIINIAGNSETKNNNISVKVGNYLDSLFTKLKSHEIPM